MATNKLMLTSEEKFCVRYLLNHGINGTNFERARMSLGKNDPDYKLVIVEDSEKNFFEELAEKMRELWPPGEKDGKWPWRDSVNNLVRRLKHLWEIRKLGEYTIDECLTVARRYLAQFEENAKYMQTLKYFILKQDVLLCQNGKEKLIDKSTFADMLESNSTLDDWSDIFESSDTYNQGELI